MYSYHIGIRSRCKQCGDSFGFSAFHCEMQGREALSVAFLDARSVRQQQLDQLNTARQGSVVQRQVAPLIWSVRIGGRTQESLAEEVSDLLRLSTYYGLVEFRHCMRPVWEFAFTSGKYVLAKQMCLAAVLEVFVKRSPIASPNPV